MSAAATDLRHMTSTSALISPRLSQHLRTHSPARSPTSIPSSPTSVHSSSSAIFERDIEPLCPPSPQAHTTLHANAHRIPRSKTTEQIEHSVPSVLDSAAAILASIQNTNDVAIVAPAPYSSSFAGSGFASPIGSIRSRSPSPTIGSLAAHGRNSHLLSIPQQQHHQQVMTQQAPSATRSPPAIQTTTGASPAPPAIVTPTSEYFSVADESETGSPVHSSDEAEVNATTAPVSIHDASPALPTTTLPPPSPAPLPRLSSPTSTLPTSHPHSPSPSSPASQHHHPHSPTNAASKRLSFISYADLLSSAPTSTLPLSSLTTAASAAEPPPHLSGVSPGPGSPGSTGTSLRGFAMASPGAIHDAFGTSSVRGKRDSAVLGPDDVGGGEWEREGLGRGLAERLDVLYGTASG